MRGRARVRTIVTRRAIAFAKTQLTHTYEEQRKTRTPIMQTEGRHGLHFQTNTSTNATTKNRFGFASRCPRYGQQSEEPTAKPENHKQLGEPPPVEMFDSEGTLLSSFRFPPCDLFFHFSRRLQRRRPVRRRAAERARARRAAWAARRRTTTRTRTCARRGGGLRPFRARGARRE